MGSISRRKEIGEHRMNVGREVEAPQAGPGNRHDVNLAKHS